MGCSQSIEANQGQRVSSVQRIPEPEVQCSASQPTIDVESSDKHVDYLAQMSQIKAKILALPESNKLFRNYAWEHIFNTFQKLYLNTNQKLEFIEFLSNLLEVNFSQAEVDNQLIFCGQMGTSFQTLQNKIYFKHKYCLQNFFFAIKPQNQQNILDHHFGALSMDLSDQQVQKLTGKVRNLCQNDLNSFSFITLYLIHAIRRFLETKKSFSEVQTLLESVLLKLQQLYPASTNSTNLKQEQITFKNLKKVKITVNYDVVKFVKGPTNNYDQLKDFVFQKAKGAKDDKNLFFELVHKICTKKGYGFRHGLKIKDENHEAAIFRTIQKVLDEEKYEQAFLAQKKKILSTSQKYDNKTKINKMKSFVQMEKSEVRKLIVDILQKQQEIHFDAKDLLRAKCLYSKPSELIEAVEELLQSFSDKNISLLMFKNRLNKKTKDLTLVINLPHSIAELQLALKFDTTSNQFNHKIYELLRSRIYTPLTNLYVQNETWSSAFFADQFEIFHEIVKNGGMDSFDQEITFKEIENEVIEFKQKFLTNDFLSIAIDSEENNVKMQSQTLLNPLKNLKDIISHGYEFDEQPINREHKQILNEIAFFQKSNNYKQAQRLLSQTQDMQNLKQDQMIMRFKAQLFYQKQDHASALELYEKLIQIHQTNNLTETVDFAQDEKQAGLCCKYLGAFQDALEYLNDALRIYQKLLGKQTFEYSNILYTLGMVYDDQKNYPLALETYSQCLKIKQEVSGKDTMEVANTIHNMGLIYSTTGKYDESADCYEKCLKIQQYVNGKQSLECAITLGNMGVLYDTMKLPLKALEMHERSLAIKQKISGRQSIDCSIALNNIAMIYQSQKNYDKALGYYLQSMEIKQKIKGKEDIDCAYLYLNVSILYCNMKRYTDAISYVERSYEIRSKVLGEDHPDTELSLEWMNYEKSLMEQQENRN